MNAETIKRLILAYKDSTFQFYPDDPLNEGNIKYAEFALTIAIDEMQRELDEAKAEIFRLRNEVEDLKAAAPVENHGQDYLVKE